jgi:hypothetical protein
MGDRSLKKVSNLILKWKLSMLNYPLLKAQAVLTVTERQDASLKRHGREMSKDKKEYLILDLYPAERRSQMLDLYSK